VYALPVGLAVAGGLADGAWIWPGDPLGAAWDMASDLPAAAAAAGAPAPLVVALVVLLELAIAAAAVTLVARYGAALTGRRRTGFATSTQAQQILGVTRLRAVRREVRPDLYDQARADQAHAGATRAADRGRPAQVSDRPRDRARDLTPAGPFDRDGLEQAPRRGPAIDDWIQR